MRCAVYQPGYFQPLHYYARMLSVDRFVLLDKAQLNRKVGQTHATVYGKGGTVQLTVPVMGGNRLSLDEAIPDYAAGWEQKHLATIRQLYKNAPMFSYWYPMLEEHLLLMKEERASLGQIGCNQAFAIL